MRRFISGASLALAALLLLPGCGGGSGGGAASKTAGFDGRNVPTQTNLAGLQVTITADKTTYRTGETINLNIAVTNVTTSDKSVSFPSGSKTVWWGYLIAQNGRIATYEYWKGHNLSFTADVVIDHYAPGETHRCPYVFPFNPSGQSAPLVSALPPGTYQVYARLPDLVYDGTTPVRHDVPTPVSDPVTITVTP